MLSYKISLKTILLTLIGLAVAGGAIGFAVVMLGLPTTSARPPHWPITMDVLHTVFKRSVAERADTPPPADLMSEARITLGAQHFENVCSKCHGGPGLGQSPIALSMRPRPQHLPDVVNQFTDEELYVIVRDGVRFSAMPAWPSTGNRDEIWSLVAFLRQLPEMEAKTYIDMVSPVEGAPDMPYGAVGALANSDTGIKAPPLDEYLYAVPATEWVDISLGGTPVATCARCHGKDGSGAATGGLAPNLTLQTADYISDALRAYATGRRESGIMKVVASGLSPDQIEALGRYYDALPDVANPAPAADEAMLERAEKIAYKGKPLEAVAPCFTCHQREDVIGPMKAPHLTGQNAAYLAAQLHSFAQGQRGSPGVYNPMIHESHYLAPQDVDALTAYFAGLPVETVPQPLPMAADDANAAGIVSRVCAKCHQATGTGVASGEFPNLTIQTPEYLAHQLHSFAANQRKNERMLQVARGLSETDIENLASYFGNAPGAPAPGFSNPVEAKAGERIAQNGLRNGEVPACLTCHGTQNAEALPIVARLQGQNAAYLKDRLDYLARPSSLPLPGINPMHPIAAALTEEERGEVAAYFASLPPLPK